MGEAVTEKDTGLYRVVKFLAPLFVNFLMPVRYHHPERAKMEPPFVMISNHVHALDPVILGYAVRHTQAVYLGKKELAKNRLARWFLTGMHTILVDRHNMDMAAMRDCMKALKMKKVLVIFPEGTRHHEGQMEHIESGASFLILRGRVPVLPVYIDRPLKLFRRVNAWVGEPIPCEDLLAEGVNNETCEKLNERMRETFRALVREAGDAPGNAS